MAQQKTINKRAVFAEIHQDREGKAHTFALKYVKKDGTVGMKSRVSKSNNALPGDKKYRGNVSLNNILLLYDWDVKKHFEVLIDLITHYNGMRIIHNF